jgi:hypothetical protein
MTAQQLITDALVVLQELDRGQTPAPGETEFAFRQLNALLDSWSTERLSIHKVNQVIFTLSDDVQDYTIGPSGDFVQERPVLIQTATIIFKF